MIKICICSCIDAERFENTYRNTLYKNIPKTIHWVRKSDGSFETGTFQNKEINGKVKCQCGKYMKTHLHEHTRHDEYGNAYGKSWYEMIARCSCDNPKPTVIEIDDKEIIITMTLKELKDRDHHNWVRGFNHKLKDKRICEYLDKIRELL